jgi:hypothetical protein
MVGSWLMAHAHFLACPWRSLAYSALSQCWEVGALRRRVPEVFSPLWMAVIGAKYCTVPPYAVVRLKDEETVIIENVISRSFRTVLASSLFNGQSHRSEVSPV